MLDIIVEMAEADAEVFPGSVSRERKLEFISALLDAGLDVRVRTTFEPSSCETLLDLGSDLARTGVKRWLITPETAVPDPNTDRLAREEIQLVLTAFPWIRIDSEIDRACGLVDPEGNPISAGSRAHREVITDLRGVDSTVVRRLDANPKLLYSIAPREFEQLVAYLLEQRGYKVTLTPATRDGGKDLYLACKSDLGNFLYVVECKRYAPDQPVGVEMIRALYGVVQAERATAGILATTSFFSKEAREFQGRLQFQIQLHDYYDLQRWLRDALKKVDGAHKPH